MVHSFSRVAYLLPVLPLPLPKLMTYQRDITRRSVTVGHWLSRGTLHFSAISRQMMTPVADVGSWHLVFNGVRLASYDFKSEAPADAPLVFLGRIERDRDNPSFILVTRKRALEEAEASRKRRREGHAVGPLDGVPIAWKDLVDMAAERTTAGSGSYR